MHTGLTASVSGRVQGVMFRDFVRRKAQSLGLVGYVQNLPSGEVEVYAEGEEETLARFIEFLKGGSMFSHVGNIAYRFVHPAGEYKDFSIIYD